MTKKIIALLVVLAICLTTYAQWNKVDNSIKNGRPATALVEAKKQLATAKTSGERMQALLCVGQLQQEITPDSFFATVRVIDDWHRTTHRCDERAVTAIVIARLLEANQWRSQYNGAAAGVRSDDMRQWSRADYRAAVNEYRRAAWSEPFDSLHAVKAKAWVPFIELETEGHDVLASRWWKDDLLHVILADAPDSVWTRAKQFYATVGCYEPQIEDYIRRCRDSIDVCREGINIYKEEKRVAVLQNELMRIECPQFSTESRQAFYPAHEYTFQFKVKNVSAYTIHTYRLAAELRRWDVATIRANGKRISEQQYPAVSSLGYTTPASPGYYALIITPTPTRDVKKVEPIVMPMRVSPYQLLRLEQADGQSRFVVTDALSGKPVEGVKVNIDRDRAHIEGDAQQPMYFGRVNPYRADTSTRRTYSLFTDRAIYRPGQTVQMSLVAYESQTKSAQVLKDREIVVHCRTANYEQIQADTLRTDAFGSATATLTLPADAEPGVWVIQTEHGHASFRVEEYKRPTFAIEMEQVDTPLVVRVEAKNFNGVPLRGARVTGHYSISQPWWWRNYMHRFAAVENVDVVENIDTLITDAQGHALISIPTPKVEARFAQLILSVDVTSASGETHSHELHLPLRHDELAIQTNVPEMVERAHITPWDVKLVDATGRTVPGEIMCTVTAYEPPCPAILSQVPLQGLPSTLATLPTARYRITFAHGDVKSEEHCFSLFSIDDKSTPDTVHFYATADTLPCRLHIGTCLDDVTLFVNAYDGRQVVWNKQITLNKEARTLDLAPATHSDGITVSFAFVRDENVYTWTHTFTNPSPDNRLRWHWDTFRDRTTPGSQERWRGTLLRPDGKPASANVMLTIYDASLDALTPHNWQLAFQPRMQTARCTWNRLSRSSGWWMGAGFTLPLLREPELLYHHFSYKYLTGSRFTNGVRTYKANMLMASAAPNSAKQRAAGAVVTEECCDEAAVLDAADNIDNPEQLENLRQDFSEAAVFAPSLRTDQHGRFTLDFTLPESVTTWQLLGVAHTEDMMTATTRQQCVAQKEVMVQLGVPRFLRLGDEGSVTATVTNLTPEALPATLTVCTSNRLTFSLSLAANSDTTITVPIPAASLDDLPVTATVTTALHSDGEQRMIPVIDNRSWITETIDLATQGNKKVEVQQQSGEATITFTPAPVWTAVSALPDMMSPDENDAISLANAYFATTLTHHLATTMPQIQERRQFALDSLLAAADNWHRILQHLQKEDGSFAWFAGGTGSPFITTEVCVELARLQSLTDRRSPLLDKAMKYLSREVDKEIAWQKKNKIKTVSSQSFFYLYASALMNRRATQTDYLLPLIAKELTHYDLNNRALAAVIFKHYGREREARRFITSLNEHIVTTSERGSYFDYPGGSFTSINRKLQTLTTAIEAKTLLCDTLHLAGLRRNLLQQRRVQGWDSKLFATAAVAAVLSPTPYKEGSVMLAIDDVQHAITTDTVMHLTTVPRNIVITPRPVTPKGSRGEAESEAVRGGDGERASEAWGALFIRRLLPNDSITSSGTGMTLRYDHPTEARVGDRITLQYVITVERDYEWVRLSVPRPAGLEPTEVLSGYRHQNGLSYYLSQHDDREDLFFERMPRGTYIIESQAFADRPGCYHTSPATITCVYAPEFTAHTGQANITIFR